MSPAGLSDSLESQIQASREIADAIVTALTTERGVHAETAVVSAARMAGTFLFRSFRLPTTGLAPGSPVLSDQANERGPLLLEVLQAGLSGLGITVDAGAMQDSPEHRPQLTFLESQRALEPRLAGILTARGLDREGAARACALATALLIHRTRSVLDPRVGFGLAVYGLVEGTKTMPAPVQQPAKPWYKLW
jgi:hypothetical protein